MGPAVGARPATERGDDDDVADGVADSERSERSLVAASSSRGSRGIHPPEPDPWDDEWVPDPWAEAEGAEDDPDLARADDLDDDLDD